MLEAGNGVEKKLKCIGKLVGTNNFLLSYS